MKRVLLITTMLLAIGVYTWSQDVTFGVRGGLNVSTAMGEDIGDYAKYKPGFKIGVTLDYGISNGIYLLTGLELAQKGFKSTETYSSWNTGVSYKVTASPLYLQLPLNIGYKIELAENTWFVPQAGPYVAYGIAGKVSSKVAGSVAGIGGEIDASHDFFSEDGGYKNFDFGIGVGAGLEIDHLGLNLGYELGLINISKNSDSPVKNGNLFVTVGYKF
jgi:hypothetical protein